MAKSETVGNIVMLTFAIGMLVLGVLSLVGLGYLTKYTFRAERVDDMECVQVTVTERNIARLAVVLSWISIVMSVLGAMGYASTRR